ncbi:hypothetical protein [Micromonospora carbonacea]|uniref:Uncharacterized protein n=1 Tax=Micromonospora carbonacea TaxID=47853 RepID=A0A7H8XJ97_9ACTN|nr:hypothetical protein [Micromonospora carbonacea]MBB5827549.1 hypothetical protein [Micromonospora carbonacea]QLD24700.1 hypothetical protein HXZ27_11225 [Micromonospora carbonacea]
MGAATRQCAGPATGPVARVGAALAVAVAAFAGPLAAGAWAAGPAVAAPAPEPPPGPPGGEQPGWLVFVEVTPSTVQPGYLVGIRASCHDNSVPAIVVSDAFGRVAVHPQRGLLAGTPMVRERIWPGNYRVKLECRGGETATTMLQVVKKQPSPAPTHKPTYQPTGHPTYPPTHYPSRGPNTGFGGTARGATDGLLLPGGVALTVAGVTIGVATARRPRSRRGGNRR